MRVEHEKEFTVRAAPFSEAFEMALNNKIKDGPSRVAILKAKEYLERLPK